MRGFFLNAKKKKIFCIYFCCLISHPKLIGAPNLATPYIILWKIMKCKCNQHLPPKRNQRFDLSFKKIDLSEWKNGSFQNSDMTSERQSTRMKGSDFFCVCQ